jgi:hypothetical protein
VREIEDAMPATELTEWALFYDQHPFGEYRADLRAGIVAAVVAATAGNKNAKPSDFMPLVKREAEATRSGPSAAAVEAAAVTNAFMKASSRLKHHFIRRKKRKG